MVLAFVFKNSSHTIFKLSVTVVQLSICKRGCFFAPIYQLKTTKRITIKKRFAKSEKKRKKIAKNLESSKSRRIFASLKTTSTNTNKIYSIMQPQNYVECILAHCPADRYPHLSARVIKKWDDDFMLTALIDIANEHYLVGYMSNDDGRAYGTRYAKNLPEPCFNALKWADSMKDQSSRLWSQWTIER